MKDARIERIPQEGNGKENSFPGIYEEASHIARGVLRAIQEVAGTTYCKGVQIAELTKWAKANGYWFENVDTLGEFVDRGSENEVYVSSDYKTVYKLNDFRYSDDNLIPFFERIKAHNHYFKDCAYSLIGFSINKQGKTCAVLSQPFIVSLREATQEEINTELSLLGFTPQMSNEYFSNETHDIFDALPNNVLLGVDERLYFIDTIIYQSCIKGFEKYKSLSPRFSK